MYPIIMQEKSLVIMLPLKINYIFESYSSERKLLFFSKLIFLTYLAVEFSVMIVKINGACLAWNLDCSPNTILHIKNKQR